MKAIIRAFVKKLVIVLYRVMCVGLPVHMTRIVFNSSMGKSYAGNPRYIYEYLVEHGQDKKWDCIWFYEKEPYDIPGGARQIRYGRLRYLYYMATAKGWVFDCRQPEWLIKRKGCFYIQTWHGTPLKKLGLDMKDVYMQNETDIDSYQQGFVKNVKTWDYLISQNPFSTETFRRAFAFEGDMLEFGYPRNDGLFQHNNEADLLALKQRMGLPADKKILLYAPTFRDDEFSADASYTFRPRLDFEQMQHELGDEYVLIVKYHYLIMDCLDWTPYQGFVVPFDQSRDIAELFLVADMLITDYSSVMFDYSLLKRPILFYAYDLDKYRNDLRGFYFHYEEEMPGPISMDTSQLIRDIHRYRSEDYRERYEAFSQKYNPWDDGNASGKVVELMESLLQFH